MAASAHSDTAFQANMLEKWTNKQQPVESSFRKSGKVNPRHYDIERVWNFLTWHSIPWNNPRDNSELDPDPFEEWQWIKDYAKTHMTTTSKFLISIQNKINAESQWTTVEKLIYLALHFTVCTDLREAVAYAEIFMRLCLVFENENSALSGEIKRLSADIQVLKLMPLEQLRDLMLQTLDISGWAFYHFLKSRIEVLTQLAIENMRDIIHVVSGDPSAHCILVSESDVEQTLEKIKTSDGLHSSDEGFLTPGLILVALDVFRERGWNTTELEEMYESPKRYVAFRHGGYSTILCGSIWLEESRAGFFEEPEAISSP